MKQVFTKDRITTVLATLAVCGATYAAVTPLTFPWQEMVEPTEHHERVLAGVGHFEGNLIMEMPGAPEPMKMPCKEVVTGIGEFWTTAHFESEFFGMPFVGSATLGYDIAKGKYVGTWIDSMTTAIIPMEGDFDADKNAIVMHYENLDPESGTMQKMRSETVHTEMGYTSTFYVMGEEKDHVQMVIEMKRAAKAHDAGHAR